MVYKDKPNNSEFKGDSNIYNKQQYKIINNVQKSARTVLSNIYNDILKEVYYNNKKFTISKDNPYLINLNEKVFNIAYSNVVSIICESFKIDKSKIEALNLKLKKFDHKRFKNDLVVGLYENGEVSINFRYQINNELRVIKDISKRPHTFDEFINNLNGKYQEYSKNFWNALIGLYAISLHEIFHFIQDNFIFDEENKKDKTNKFLFIEGSAMYFDIYLESLIKMGLEGLNREFNRKVLFMETFRKFIKNKELPYKWDDDHRYGMLLFTIFSKSYKMNIFDFVRFTKELSKKDILEDLKLIKLAETNYKKEIEVLSLELNMHLKMRR